MSKRSRDIFVLMFILLAAMVSVDILQKYQPNTPIIPIILGLFMIIGISGIVIIMTKYSNKE